ncbi:hypothetical protein AGR4C_pb20058 [Agrobacterium tumefaciens str. Kerr 14]|uniref:Uncharacterized protein n=1 Tax=Agrobacterium tumefaciens str. Kerr 14 TaxID=1183424 RepID=A0A1S7SDV8_AGRTU|nr:hypothetical protein AGR4C_pb20058 [Agrobacterium tumefaciens str. Kerr 14]
MVRASRSYSIFAQCRYAADSTALRPSPRLTMLAEKWAMATGDKLLSTNLVRQERETPNGPARAMSNTSRQRRIIAPLDPLLRNGGIILQSVGFADVQICTFLRRCFWGNLATE